MFCVYSTRWQGNKPSSVLDPGSFRLASIIKHSRKHRTAPNGEIKVLPPLPWLHLCSIAVNTFAVTPRAQSKLFHIVACNLICMFRLAKAKASSAPFCGRSALVIRERQTFLESGQGNGRHCNKHVLQWDLNLSEPLHVWFGDINEGIRACCISPRQSALCTKFWRSALDAFRDVHAVMMQDCLFFTPVAHSSWGPWTASLTSTIAEQNDSLVFFVVRLSFAFKPGQWLLFWLLCILFTPPSFTRWKSGPTGRKACSSQP